VRALWLTLACSAAALAAPPPPKATFQLVRVPVTMRDGVRLSANVFLPSERAHLPAILVRTPYGKGSGILPNYQTFVDHGYAVIVEDVRGRYDSEGAFEPLTATTPSTGSPASRGRTAMWACIGGSYLGIAQWKAALAHNPHLKAIFPVRVRRRRLPRSLLLPGGAMKLGHRLLWLAENMRAPGYDPPDFCQIYPGAAGAPADVLGHRPRAPLWQMAPTIPAYDSSGKMQRSRAPQGHPRPVYSVGGWYDNYVESDLDAFCDAEQVEPRGPHHDRPVAAYLQYAVSRA
jgi:putative CocE/NonD family hydrolase